MSDERMITPRMPVSVTIYFTLLLQASRGSPRTLFPVLQVSNHSKHDQLTDSIVDMSLPHLSCHT